LRFLRSAAVEHAETPAPSTGERRATKSPAETPPARDRRRPPRVDPAGRELRRRVEVIEREIHALEARLEELGAALADPALYAEGERVRAIATERKRAEAEVAWLMREWEELSTALAAHERCPHGGTERTVSGAERASSRSAWVRR
jgi:predicted RNase H-like nuclease (RuvC/YqgF family)